MKNSSKKTIILLIISIFFVVFFQTVAYSAFSESLDVNGHAYARLETDVRVTDFRISDKNTSTNFISEYEKFGRYTVSSALTFLSDEIVYFDVEVTNYNSNKVYINSILNVPDNLSLSLGPDISEILDGIGTMTFTIGLSGTGKFVLDLGFEFKTVYNVTYSGFSGSGYPDIILSDEELSIDFGSEKVNGVSIMVDGVEYTDFTLENNILTFGPVYGDVLITKKENLVRLISGDLNTIGSEVAIGDEHFYIFKNDGLYITMLAKYNLYVGSIVDENLDVTPLSNSTGIQNSTAIGGRYDESGAPNFFPWYAVIDYSPSAYWNNGTLKSQYGTSYPAYVYDSNSIIYNYVENYRTYLENQGAIVEDARLISFEELKSLGCNYNSYNCNSAPSWVYGTSYWSGSALDNSYMYTVSIFASFSRALYSADFLFGIRPVIEIPLSEF